MSFFKNLLESSIFCFFISVERWPVPVFVFSRSRLGCQVCLSKALDGLVAKVPESVADARQSQDGTGNAWIQSVSLCQTVHVHGDDGWCGWCQSCPHSAVPETTDTQPSRWSPNHQKQASIESNRDSDVISQILRKLVQTDKYRRCCLGN